MMKSRALALSGFLLSAISSCSSEGDLLDAQTGSDELLAGLPDKSGSRLKVSYFRYTAGDGARLSVPRGFYDARFKTDCYPNIAEDGVSRCLPTNVSQVGIGNTAYYQDAACTQPVVLLLSGGCGDGYTLPSFFKEDGPSVACKVPVTKIYQVGAVISPTTLYSRQIYSSSPCTTVTDVAGVVSGGTVYSTTHIAATDFVKAEITSITLP